MKDKKEPEDIKEIDSLEDIWANDKEDEDAS